MFHLWKRKFVPNTDIPLILQNLCNSTFKFICKLLMSPIREQSFRGDLQFCLQQLILEQLVNGGQELIGGKIVGIQAATVASFVQSLGA
ncbi:hypothetical protein TYRP_022175 [Tyrophagus putrescentiae]|nr:hypothetical protein TYRP_022175 [Tyrophagus putrescentiae]